MCHYHLYHSTIIEITRCLAKQNSTTASEEVLNAVKQYNHTIHSVLEERPVDVQKNSAAYPKIVEKLRINQKKLLDFHNKKSENRRFEPNEIIYVKSNRRRKDSNTYTKHFFKEDIGNSVLTTKNKVFHKDSIRRN